jgi:hypothetical protein
MFTSLLHRVVMLIGLRSMHEHLHMSQHALATFHGHPDMNGDHTGEPLDLELAQCMCKF